MGLTYRDGIATALIAAAVAATLAVTEGWDWPLLGSVAAGVVAVGVLGYLGCMAGTRTQDMSTMHEFTRRPGMILGAILGVVALVTIVGGLIAATEAWLVALTATLVALWAVATVRHAFTESAPRLAPVH